MVVTVSGERSAGQSDYLSRISEFIKKKQGLTEPAEQESPERRLKTPKMVQLARAPRANQMFKVQMGGSKHENKGDLEQSEQNFKPPIDRTGESPHVILGRVRDTRPEGGIDQVISDLVKLRTLQLQTSLSEKGALGWAQMTRPSMARARTRPVEMTITTKKNTAEHKENWDISNTLDFKFRSQKLGITGTQNYQYHPPLRPKNPTQAKHTLNPISTGTGQEEKERDVTPAQLKSVSFEKSSLQSVQRPSRGRLGKSSRRSVKISKFGLDADCTFEADFNESFFSGTDMSKLPKSSHVSVLGRSGAKGSGSGMFVSEKGKTTGERAPTGSVSMFCGATVSCFICGEKVPTRNANAHVRRCKLRRRSEQGGLTSQRVQRVRSSEFIER